jgi:hypothetical protein
MSTWTPKDIATARACIEGATTLTEGYAAAVAKLTDRTVTAIRIARERGVLGDPAPEPKVRVEARATATAISTLRLGQLVDALKIENKRLVDAVAAREEELDLFKSVDRGPKVIKAPSTKGRNPTQIKASGVVLASDWHVEEPVFPDHVNGLNEYNLVIAKERIDRFVKSVVWLLSDPRFDIRSLTLGLIGDLISGYIHEELVESNLLSPAEAIVWLLDALEGALRSIAAQLPAVERIVVVCKSGNHGRLTHKQKVSTREANSIEAVLYQSLRRLLANDPRFEFVITPGIWAHVTVFDYDLAFTHGDSFKYGGGVGGVSIPIKRGITREFLGRHRPIHQFNMGHFHQRQDFGNIQLNGSLIGYSDYSQFVHCEYERPQQHLYLVVENRGKGPVCPVWVDEEVDSRATAKWQDPDAVTAPVERKAA